MKKSEFISFIENPDLLNANHIQALKKVCTDFPYFANAQVLLAKVLHMEHHYEFEKHLNQAALNAPNREVLYYYLNQNEVNATVNQPQIVEKTDETVFDEAMVIELKNQLSEINIDLPVEDVDSASVAENAEVNTPLLTVQVDEPVTVEPAAKTDDVVEPDLLFNEKEPHSFIEWLNYTSKHHKLPVTEEDLNNTDTDKNDIAVDDHANEAITLTTQTETLIKEEIIFEAPAPPEENPKTSITQVDIEDAVAKSNINQFQSILDKFIKENPSISRPKAEFYNPQNKAKQSVEEDEDLVTETLANLYYKQGNHKKAIRAYEKLCLLYPSKMTYFATLINKIKTELKD